MGSIQSLLLLAFLSLLGLAACSDTSLQDKCSPEMAKLPVCLDYASDKADMPSEGCCSTVKDIRGRAPECLCFIIQQTHNGGPTVQSFGLQISRLIQLPQACKLANSSVSDCPKLLKLSPSSPDYAIFTNTTKAASSSTGLVTASQKSEGTMQQIYFHKIFAFSVLSTIFLSIFSMGA